MLIEEIKNIKSDKRELKQFATVMWIFLVALGVFAFLRAKPVYIYLFSFSLFFFVAGFVIPQVLKPLQKTWMSIAVIMGFFMSRVILAIVFFLVITPIGAFMKLLGKDILNEKINKACKSYWILREESSFDKVRCEKQY